MSEETCDVAVIGGGPAGSTAAALLARRGHRVIALEKAHHPRFHIGESLLPMNLPLFERLGVADKVRALGVFKPGADFEADNERGYNTFAFARAIGQSPPHAYQVWRQDFDRMLFEHARECGASAREGHEVVRFEQRGPRDTQLEVRTDDGRSYRIQARYLIDASGRDAFLAGKKKLRRKNDEHQSAAIFGHFRGAQARAGRGCRQHQHVSLRARLDVDDPAARRGDERGSGMPAGLPEAAQGPHRGVPARDAQAQRGAVAAHRARRADRQRGARHRQLLLRLTPAGRTGLDADRRRFCVPRSGVLVRRVPGDEWCGAGGAGGGRGAARAGTRAGAAAQPGEAPARRHDALLVLHLPLQQSGDGAVVPPAEQSLADRAGRDLDARRRPVFDTRRCCGACRLFKLVYAFLGLLDWRRWHGEYRYRLCAGAHANSPAATRRWTGADAARAARAALLRGMDACTS